MTAALPRSTHFRESRSARERAAVASWEGAGTSNGRVGRALLGHRCVTPPIGHPTHPFCRRNSGATERRHPITRRRAGQCAAIPLAAGAATSAVPAFFRG